MLINFDTDSETKRYSRKDLIGHSSFLLTQVLEELDHSFCFIINIRVTCRHYYYHCLGGGGRGGMYCFTDDWPDQFKSASAALVICRVSVRYSLMVLILLRSFGSVYEVIFGSVNEVILVPYMK